MDVLDLVDELRGPFESALTAAREDTTYSYKEGGKENYQTNHSVHRFPGKLPPRHLDANHAHANCDK
jgi:hypothetical protein